MRLTKSDRLDKLQTIKTVLEMNLNDMRILVRALDAQAYFGEQHGEDYLESDGRELRTRLRRHYEEALAPVTQSDN